METETLDKPQERITNASDRCDRCGAEAFVWVDGVAGDMYFCGHHFTKHEDAIRKYAFEILDERHFLK